MSKRRYDIDWLRVIAIILVLYFHVGMVFTAEWGWHIKNEEQSYLVLEINFFLRQFRMPLLFLISGVGSWFAFRKRSIWQYVKERHHRLVIPLIFAMLIIVPPQIYMERIFQGENFSSFLDFYPTVFNSGPYPQGNLSWHHMWFVLYLFLYSLIAAPLFFYIRTEKGKNVKNFLKWFDGDFSIYLLFLPAVVWYTMICYYHPSTNDLIHDGAFFIYWFSFFVAGYVIACNESMWERLKSNRRASLGAALFFTIAVNYMRWNKIEDQGLVQDMLTMAFASTSGWLWIYAILGYAQEYLNKPSRLLQYSNQGIYPFYIIHQTIIVILAYYVVQLEAEGIFFKYFFLSTLSLVLSVAFYEFCVRPFTITRFLFGMKDTKVKNKVVASSEKLVTV